MVTWEKIPFEGDLAKIDPTPDADHQGEGYYVEGTVGEAVTIGQVLYYKSDGKWWKADADLVTTMPVEGLAMEAKAAQATCKILIDGVFRDDTWAWTVGGRLYASCTVGALTQTAPSGTGDQVQDLGFAISADVIRFKPNAVLVEIS